MNDTIRIRAGNRWKDGKDQLASITLGDRELVYCKDENALYIGDGLGGKKRIGGITDEEKQEIINEAVAKALAEFEKLTAEA